MCPVIRLSDELYERLGGHAVGFETPPKVIERILDQVEGVESAATKTPDGSLSGFKDDRLYTNKEIQQKISATAQRLPMDRLEALCEEETSKRLFGISFPLFIRLPVASNQAVKRAAVKTPDGVNRWTWKYEFEREGQIYAICTQWYPRNDLLVKGWLEQ